MKAKSALWSVAALPGVAAVVWLAASMFCPQLLAFPYRTMVGETPVYSSTPLSPGVADVIARADERVRASPLFRPGILRRPIFLTDGGLRWRILSLGSGGAFGVTRPLAEHVVVNRSSIADDRVWNGSAVAGSRSLSGVIAHERTHMLIRARFGLIADRLYPVWVREGYCDHVAGGGTLTDAEAARLRAEGSAAPALFYYDSRKRVERELAASGGSVEALFRASRQGASKQAD